MRVIENLTSRLLLDITRAKMVMKHRPSWLSVELGEHLDSASSHLRLGEKCPPY
jgi:hypothetical protein